MPVRHFLSLDNLSSAELHGLIDRAIELKKQLIDGKLQTPLLHKTLAMIFTKSSTRTRISFEIGMRQLGGGAITLNPSDSQIDRGESLEDTARVVSSMADGIMMRTGAHANIELLAKYSSVPVINGLTDDVHPCQLLADVLTIKEALGSYKDITVAWIGDGNNVCHSWMNAARLFGFRLNIATPVDFQPYPHFIKLNDSAISLGNDPKIAIQNAHVVVTDTWASMGQENEKAIRESAFMGYCVDDSLMSNANTDAIFLHCLPAYRGKEVSASVLEGSQSVVFQEAENRLHAQRALLEFLLAN